MERLHLLSNQRQLPKELRLSIFLRGLYPAGGLLQMTAKSRALEYYGRFQRLWPLQPNRPDHRLVLDKIHRNILNALGGGVVRSQDMSCARYIKRAPLQQSSSSHTV